MDYTYSHAVESDEEAPSTGNRPLMIYHYNNVTYYFDRPGGVTLDDFASFVSENFAFWHYDVGNEDRTRDEDEDIYLEEVDEHLRRLDVSVRAVNPEHIPASDRDHDWIRESENFTAMYEIEDTERDRIASATPNREEFQRVWENEDWWLDSNND